MGDEMRFDLFNNRVEYQENEKRMSIHVDTIAEGMSASKPSEVNKYCGTDITLRLGEGLLDFVYADFLTPFKKALFDTSIDDALNEYNRQKKGDVDSIIDAIEDYAESFAVSFRKVSGIAYASIYSSIHPPVFGMKNTEVQIEKRVYTDYLLSLQKRYRKLLEICFDEDYHKELLGGMDACGRYSAYRTARGLELTAFEVKRFSLEKLDDTHIHDFKATGASIVGNETAAADFLLSGGGQIAAGGLEDHLKDTDSPSKENDMAALAAEWDCDTDTLGGILSNSYFVQSGIMIKDLEQMLEFELLLMLEKGVRMKRCKRCGKFFIVKGNYASNYCDRVAAGDTRNCQDLAALENYKKKNEGNTAVTLYQKYYKRYAARVRSFRVDAGAFADWKAEAMKKRNDCMSGKLSTDEFTSWLENSL